jgi:hypothetical protein
MCSRIGALIAVLWTAAGCADATRTGVERTVRGDTVVVHNYTPVFRDTATVRLITRYGTFEGPEAEMFSSVGSIAVRPNGNVILVDGRVGLKEFNADGTFERWIARYGHGPNEVHYTKNGLAVAPDDRVAIEQFGRGWISFFDASFAPQTRRVQTSFRERNGEDAFQFHDDGSLWIGMNPSFAGDSVIRFPRPAFLRLGTGGEWDDTIFVPERYATACPVLSHLRHARGFWEDNREPFVYKAQWALGPDGSRAFGCNRAFEFDVVRPGGQVLRVVRAGTSAPFVDGELEQMAGWIDLDLSLVQDRPAYARIILTADQRIWVWPNVTPDTMVVSDDVARAGSAGLLLNVGEHGAFEVFERDGRWIGSVRLPDELHYSGYPTEPPVVIRGDTIWGVTVDEFDVEYVSRYEVVWPRQRPES